MKNTIINNQSTFSLLLLFYNYFSIVIIEEELRFERIRKKRTKIKKN